MCQHATGRLWDLLYRAVTAIRSNARGGNQLNFGVYRIPRDGVSTTPDEVTLKLILGPGDQGEPVITILHTGED